jgi:hypothetical protein
MNAKKSGLNSHHIGMLHCNAQRRAMSVGVISVTASSSAAGGEAAVDRASA